MTLEEKEFKQLDTMCEHVESSEGWPAGTLRGKSAKSEVVGYRNEIIEAAVNFQGVTVRRLASYFDKTVQSIYDSVEKGGKSRKRRERRAKFEGWLCDV